MKTAKPLETLTLLTVYGGEPNPNTRKALNKARKALSKRKKKEG